MLKSASTKILLRTKIKITVMVPVDPIVFEGLKTLSPRNDKLSVQMSLEHVKGYGLQKNDPKSKFYINIIFYLFLNRLRSICECDKKLALELQEREFEWNILHHQRWGGFDRHQNCRRFGKARASSDIKLIQEQKCCGEYPNRYLN